MAEQKADLQRAATITTLSIIILLLTLIYIIFVSFVLRLRKKKKKKPWFKVKHKCTNNRVIFSRIIFLFWKERAVIDGTEHIHNKNGPFLYSISFPYYSEKIREFFYNTVLIRNIVYKKVSKISTKKKWPNLPCLGETNFFLIETLTENTSQNSDSGIFFFFFLTF